MLNPNISFTLCLSLPSKPASVHHCKGRTSFKPLAAVRTTNQSTGVLWIWVFWSQWSYLLAPILKLLLLVPSWEGKAKHNVMEACVIHLTSLPFLLSPASSPRTDNPKEPGKFPHVGWSRTFLSQTRQAGESNTLDKLHVNMWSPDVIRDFYLRREPGPQRPFRRQPIITLIKSWQKLVGFKILNFHEGLKPTKCTSI